MFNSELEKVAETRLLAADAALFVPTLPFTQGLMIILTHGSIVQFFSF